MHPTWVPPDGPAALDDGPACDIHVCALETIGRPVMDVAKRSVRRGTRATGRFVAAVSAVVVALTVGAAMTALGAAGAARSRLHAAHGGAVVSDRLAAAGATPAAVERFLTASTDVTGLALDVDARKIYWSEYAADRIRRAGFDGSEVEDVVAADAVAPVGLAVSAALGKLYWVTDPDFPRKVQRAALDGSDVEDLIVGEDLNRPGAIAVDAEGGKIYWTESVNGKLRRANLDGSSFEDLIDRQLLTSFGLALDAEAGKVYWTDFASGTVERANLDGSEHEELLTAAHGVDAPTGIAVDAAAGKLYWADQGNESIRRATLDGFDVEDLITSADGIVEPQGLAVDVAAGKMYWADATTGKIQRANLDGSDIEDVIELEREATAPAVPPPPTGPLASCEGAVARAGSVYVRHAIKALSTCLEKISWVKAVKWRIADERVAAATCRSQASLLDDDGVATVRLREAIAAPCDPHGAGHSLTDLLTADFVDGCGGDADLGTDNAAAWIECVIDKQRAIAWAVVAARFPRTVEWIEGIRPFVAAEETPGVDRERTARAVAALDAFVAAAGGPPVHDAPARTGEAWLLGSGQTTRYRAVKNDGSGRPVAVPDDGTLQSGGALRYVDNLDGTITDLASALTWEKKCDRCRGLHDYGQSYAWSGDGGHDTIWDWLDRVNREGGIGFAGHDDWRIPSVKELVSIVDYQRFNPSAAPAFDGADCGLGCTDITDPDCSCTGMSFYWTSTTFADFPAHAITVRFNLGLVGDMPKERRMFVRAVRGGR